MNATVAALVPVLDFRRQRMVLEWKVAGGTWAPCDAATRVHGIALIRASRPNMCVYGQAGVLYFQFGADRYALSAASRMRSSPGILTLGFRRRFVLETGDGAVFRREYWTSQRHDFLQWLAERASDPAWIEASGRRWSEGLEPAALRSG